MSCFQDIDKIRGLGVGADDYMTKPFSPSELVARVKAHLSRYERLVNSAQPENDIIEIRGIRIDKTARRVFVNGEEKIFTTKEFDLLTFLAEHPNHVYTKEELFKEIWDMDSIGDIATVTVHIKKIREKIELDTLAQLAYCTESHIARVFKKHTGTTIISYVHKVRIEKSIQMIEEENLSVKEAALAAGYQNLNHFYKYFN